MPEAVIPAKAEIQRLGFWLAWLQPRTPFMPQFCGKELAAEAAPTKSRAKTLDSRLRGNDGLKAQAAGYAMALALALAMNAPLALAQTANDPTPLKFHGSAEERRFHALAAELRCVMCQNQSLADSNAMIAYDLRAEVLQLMRQGKSNDEIKAFLAQRYGEFVLYKPRVESKTWLLWFGPVALLLIGGFVVYRVVRTRSAGQGVSGDDDQEW